MKQDQAEFGFCPQILSMTLLSIHASTKSQKNIKTPAEQLETLRQPIPAPLPAHPELEADGGHFVGSIRAGKPAAAGVSGPSVVTNAT